MEGDVVLTTDEQTAKECRHMATYPSTVWRCKGCGCEVPGPEAQHILANDWQHQNMTAGELCDALRANDLIDTARDIERRARAKLRRY